MKVIKEIFKWIGIFLLGVLTVFMIFAGVTLAFAAVAHIIMFLIETHVIFKIVGLGIVYLVKFLLVLMGLGAVFIIGYGTYEEAKILANNFSRGREE